MSTLDTLVTFVKRRVKRADMDTNILEHAIDVYKSICGLMPFSGLQQKLELPLVDGEPLVSLEGLRVAGIMSVRLASSATNANFRRLKRAHSTLFDELGYVTSATPAMYCRFGNGIEIHPPPNGSNFLIRIRAWMEPVIVDTPDELTTELVWPSAWDSLGKYETLYRIYIDLDEHEKAAWLMQPMMIPRQPAPRKVRSYEMGIIPRLWNDLLRLETQREGVDEDFSINPLVRNYSMRG